MSKKARIMSGIAGITMLFISIRGCDTHTTDTRVSEESNGRNTIQLLPSNVRDGEAAVPEDAGRGEDRSREAIFGSSNGRTVESVLVGNGTSDNVDNGNTGHGGYPNDPLFATKIKAEIRPGIQASYPKGLGIDARFYKIGRFQAQAGLIRYFGNSEIHPTLSIGYQLRRSAFLSNTSVIIGHDLKRYYAGLRVEL